MSYHVYILKSKKDSKYGGDYKNYVRFVLPANATLNDIVIDDKKRETIDAITDPQLFTAKNFIAPKELELERGQVEGKDIYGLLIVVPQEKTKKISITYTAQKAFNINDSEYLYDLRVFKQPGTDEDPYSYSLTYPPIFNIISNDVRLNNVGGKLLYSGKLTSDMDFKAEFAKK